MGGQTTVWYNPMRFGESVPPQNVRGAIAKWVFRIFCLVIPSCKVDNFPGISYFLVLPTELVV